MLWQLIKKEDENRGNFYLHPIFNGRYPFVDRLYLKF